MTDKQKETRTKKSHQASQPLLRPREGRVIAGVAAGLAEQIGVAAGWVRLGFVVAAFIGGFGLLAYAVMAVIMPADDGSGKPVEEGYGPRLARVALATVLVVAALAVGGGLAALSAWATATGHGAIVGAVVIVVGLVIAATSFAGQIRRFGAPLLVLALVVGLPAGAVAAADVQIDGSVGERTYTPRSVSDIPAGGYELGTGRLVVDLRELPWGPGGKVAVKTELGFGQAVVAVPPNVCVQAQATAKGGELLVAGDRSDGIDAEVDQAAPVGKAPTLELDAELQFGQLIVTDRDPDEAGDSEIDYDHNEFLKSAQEKVCGR